MSQVKTKVSSGSITISIPATYIERAYEYGITTGQSAKVIDRNSMLEYFSEQFKSGSDDCIFGRFIDDVCSQSISDLCDFIEEDTDQ